MSSKSSEPGKRIPQSSFSIPDTELAQSYLSKEKLLGSIAADMIEKHLEEYPTEKLLVVIEHSSDAFPGWRVITRSED